MITLFFYQTIINLPRLKGDQINILLIGVCHPIKELKKERLFQNIKKKQKMIHQTTRLVTTLTIL